jgi:hypothetical protein
MGSLNGIIFSFSMTRGGLTRAAASKLSAFTSHHLKPCIQHIVQSPQPSHGAACLSFSPSPPLPLPLPIWLVACARVDWLHAGGLGKFVKMLPIFSHVDWQIHKLLSHQVLFSQPDENKKYHGTIWDMIKASVVLRCSASASARPPPSPRSLPQRLSDEIEAQSRQAPALRPLPGDPSQC